MHPIQIIEAAKAAGTPLNQIKPDGTLVYANGSTGTVADLSRQLGAARKETAKRAALAVIDALARHVTADYAVAEQQGWTVKLAEARAYTASEDADDAPTLAAEAAIRADHTLATLAARILAVAATTGVIPAIASGLRANAHAAIEASDGSEGALATIIADLESRADAVAAAAIRGNREGMVLAASPASASE